MPKPFVESPGLWRIDFRGVDGKRRKLRLGRMRSDAAHRFGEQFEHLLEDLAAGGSPSTDARKWLRRLPDHLHDRLAKLLPIERRVSLTLEQWRTQFMDGCGALQPESRRKLEQTFDKLVEYFTRSRLLREIKAGRGAGVARVDGRAESESRDSEDARG